MSRDLTAKWLRQQTPAYRNADRVYVDVLSALDSCSSLRPKTDVYTYDDGRTQLLLCLHGLLPIAYRSATYNIPVAIWLTHAYPQEPPLVYVVPTSDMLVKPSNQVDLSGKCALEYTTLWRRKPDTCSLTALLEAMQDLFSRQPPLYAKPRQEPQPSLPDSVLPASARGAPKTVAQPPALPNHGHVIPPAIPPKPQPAHAASVERSPGSNTNPAGFSAAGGASVPSHSPSTVPPVTGAPSFTPPTFAALNSSYSAPASNPQTPQIQPYATSQPSRPHDFSQPPPVPPHPTRGYSSAPAGPSSSAAQQTPVSAHSQGRPPVPPHPSSRPQPYFPVTQAQGPGYSSPPPYVAPPSATSGPHGGSNTPTAPFTPNRPPTSPARPPVPPSQYDHQRTTLQRPAVPSSPYSPQLTSSGTLTEGTTVAPPHIGAISGFQQQFQTSQPQSYNSQVQQTNNPPALVAPAPTSAYSMAIQQSGSRPPVPPHMTASLPNQSGMSPRPLGVAYGTPPQPAPMRPAPSIPPPDLLDEDDDQMPQAQSFNPVGAPPRPPNPQTVQLHNTILSQLRSSLSLLSQSVADTTARQRAMQAELLMGPAAIKDESARLVAVRDVCRSVASRWRDVVTEGEKRIAEVRRRGEVDVDEFVCATSIVGNQLINLVAEDNAIEDTMYHLHRALNSGRIDLERFLRTTRVLAEEQFMKRALVEKILNGLPMGMSMS